VLHDVSLHARRGETVALVGHTGAGKSTLINLLTRFYEHTAGEILIDGRSIRDYPRNTLREAIGVVTQESFLFNGTVRDNLRIGRQAASEEEMWRALDAANAREFVEQMPKGLDTIVGERGVKLSVGEKQRVSIARVLLKDPPILVLDEATASVDTATERQIQQALERLMENRTSFVIAHRLSTIRHADQILVMHHGRIVERGPHAELLELGGVYARLIENSEFAVPAQVQGEW
jgi:ABC-type multidrug transport system fused ATPase/permease subunit